MGKIKQLPLHEAHKIAAGEVVERPANIVKELLENAIDAGATQVSLYIQDGGKELIRIVDNGCGMSNDDAQLCFAKHATSKIQSIDQLETIATFGFRGEALASIAAIAKVTLITKEKEATEGIKLSVENSKIQKEESVAAQTGTDIAVHELFYNIPARKKFLKKRETEWRHINQLFQAFCFDYLNVHFKLFSENKTIYNCPPVQSTADRFAQVIESAQAKKLITIEKTRLDHDLHITGVVSNHSVFRYDRNGMFFFVNKRWVKNMHLSRALLKGFANVIPAGRFPLACIHISIDPTEVDVNIHPRKEEVKFMHPRIVEMAIQSAVKHALEQQVSQNMNATAYQVTKNIQYDTPPPYIQNLNTNPDVYTFNNSPYPSVSATCPSKLKERSGKASPDTSTNEKQIKNLYNSAKEDSNDLPVRHSFNESENKADSLYNFTIQQPEKTKITNDTNPMFAAQKVHQFTILGQYNKTYILIEKEDGLFFVDQHAAHERILYEEFRQNFKDIATVNLMFPQLVTLSREEIIILDPYFELLQQHGIIAEPFADDQIKITAIPVHLKNASIEELLREIAGYVVEHKNLEQQTLFKKLHEYTHAQMACKAAVKAGDTLSHEQMQKLLQNLHNTAERFSCPHGRPTSWLLELQELKKQFKRDYRSLKKHE